MANPVVSLKMVDGDISLTKMFHMHIDFILGLLFCITLFQLQFGFTLGYGESCAQELFCKENEVCRVDTSGKGICKCLPGFVEVSTNSSCISYNPGPPSDNTQSSGVGVGLGVSITVVLVLLFVLSIVLLHRRYRVLDGVIHSIYRFRRRPSRGGQAYEVADEGDDVNPIV